MNNEQINTFVSLEKIQSLGSRLVIKLANPRVADLDAEQILFAFLLEVQLILKPE